MKLIRSSQRKEKNYTEGLLMDVTYMSETK